LLWPPAATFAARTVRSSAGAILKWLAAPAPRTSIISGFCIGALFVAGLWNVIGRRSGRAASTAQRGSKELNREQRKMLLWLGMMYPKPQSIESLVETTHWPYAQVEQLAEELRDWGVLEIDANRALSLTKKGRALFN